MAWSQWHTILLRADVAATEPPLLEPLHAVEMANLIVDVKVSSQLVHPGCELTLARSVVVTGSGKRCKLGRPWAPSELQSASRVVHRIDTAVKVRIVQEKVDLTIVDDVRAGV